MWTQEEQEFYDSFQEAVDGLREETIDGILADSEEYQKAVQAESDAEVRYLQIKKQLTEEQRQIIDDFIFLKERSELLYANGAYLAGIKNVFQVRRMLRL